MEHYFSKKPGIGFRSESFETVLFDQTFKIESGSGIFSLKEVDFGTKLLIENAKIPKQDAKILDLGCGYGIIGIVLKKNHKDTEVFMCDINERAVRLSRSNCKSNDVDIKVFKSDIFSNPELKDMSFDIILTNPPFSAGKSVCQEFIRQASEHLNKGGILELVAPHNKGGESLKNYMLEIFNNAGELAKKRGYRVYISVKK